MADVNLKYSFKDFTGQTFLDVDPKEFEGIIKGSCFEQDFPFTKVFPEGIKARFIRNNLNNCFIELGMDISDYGEDKNCNHHHDVFPDLERWIIDKDGKPIEPLNKSSFELDGKNCDPTKIPEKWIREKVVTRKEYEARYAGEVPRDSFFAVKPEIASVEKRSTTIVDSALKLQSMKAWFPGKTTVQTKIEEGRAVAYVTGIQEFITLHGEGKLRRDW